MNEIEDIPAFLRRPLPPQHEEADVGRKRKENTDQEPAGVGHNSTPAGVARDQLKAIIERVERLEEEKAAISGDIKEVYAEAKANGFDTKTLRKVVALRKMDTAKRQEQEALLDLYMHALGMLSDTPLGQAALRSEFGDEAAEATN